MTHPTPPRQGAAAEPDDYAELIADRLYGPDGWDTCTDEQREDCRRAASVVMALARLDTLIEMEKWAITESEAAAIEAEKWRLQRYADAAAHDHYIGAGGKAIGLHDAAAHARALMEKQNG